LSNVPGQTQQANFTKVACLLIDDQMIILTSNACFA